MTVLLIKGGYSYIRKTDNNYGVSMIIFGYNPKLIVIALSIMLFCCKKAATGGALLKKLFIKNFVNFKGEQLNWSLFLIKL